jgi:hypothetical protein
LLHARARCVITEHLGDSYKSAPCGRPRPYIYWVVQPVCRKGDPRPGFALERQSVIGTGSGQIGNCNNNGHVKEALACLKALYQRMRCCSCSACRGMCYVLGANLELRPAATATAYGLWLWPMSREHARPQPRPQPQPRRQAPLRRRGRGASPGAGGRGHRPPNPAAQGPSCPPPDHTQPAQRAQNGFGCPLRIPELAHARPSLRCAPFKCSWCMGVIRCVTICRCFGGRGDGFWSSEISNVEIRF